MWVLRVHHFENRWPKPPGVFWFMVLSVPLSICMFYLYFFLSLFYFFNPLLFAMKCLFVFAPVTSKSNISICQPPIPVDTSPSSYRKGTLLPFAVEHPFKQTHECYDHDTVTVYNLLKVLRDMTLILQRHREPLNKSLKTVVCAVGSSFGTCWHPLLRLYYHLIDCCRALSV